MNIFLYLNSLLIIVYNKYANCVCCDRAFVGGVDDIIIQRTTGLMVVGRYYHKKDAGKTALTCAASATDKKRTRDTCHGCRRRFFYWQCEFSAPFPCPIHACFPLLRPPTDVMIIIHFWFVSSVLPSHATSTSCVLGSLNWGGWEGGGLLRK